MKSKSILWQREPTAQKGQAGNRVCPQAVQEFAEGSLSGRSSQGWTAQQIVFVGGTCGSFHIESFNQNMKALVLESAGGGGALGGAGGEKREKTIILQKCPIHTCMYWPLLNVSPHEATRAELITLLQ